MTQDDVGMASAGAAFRFRRRKELFAFFALAFGIWPIAAVGVVGSYGFAVWIWQMIFGPPGPPTG
jgi:nitrate reductase NapE